MIKQLAAAAALIFTTHAASAAVIYSNDFEGGVALLGGGTFASAEGFDGVGAIAGTVWHNDTGGGGADGTPSLISLAGIPAHSALRVSFDFMALDSWDGSTGEGGTAPSDFFNIGVDATIEFSETVDFSVESDGTISGNVSATTLVHGATLAGTAIWPDAAYHIEMLVPHSDVDAIVGFFASGSGWQGGVDESWAIDNLVIETVPAPSGLLILGAGLLALGRVRRSL